MDSTTLIPLIIAIIALVPGVWALINQSRKDRVQEKVDAGTVAQNAAIGIIQPLRDEITRLQAINNQLEIVLTQKNTTITMLSQSEFDKETQIRTMQFAMDGMKMKMDALLGTERENVSKRKIAAKNRKEDLQTAIKNRAEDVAIAVTNREEDITTTGLNRAEDVATQNDGTLEGTIKITRK